jgi:hypothetical protein
MEGGPLLDTQIKTALKDFVEVWLHFDRRDLGKSGRPLGEENQERQRAIMGFNANPYWVIYDPVAEKALRTQKFTLSVDEFLRFLRGD